MKKFYFNLLSISFTLNLACFAAISQSSFEEKQAPDATEKLDRYQKTLTWYSAYLREQELDMKKKLTTQKQYENYLKDHQQLEELIVKTQILFSDFRASVRDIVFSKYGVTPYARDLLTSPIENMTEWYVNFMQELLFPNNWEEKFHAYSDQQKTSPLVPN